MKPILETAKLYRGIRNFFDSNNFIEVQTPIMTPIPGMEPHLNPFHTVLTAPDGQNFDLYLNTSPELQMKKLLGQGLEKIYNITKVFRNGEIGGGRHNPEFTMLEWYRQDANYFDLMKDCEDLITSLLQIIPPPKNVNWQLPWPKISVHQLFIDKCDLDLLQNKDFETFKSNAEKKGFDTAGCHDWDDLFFKVFLNEIESDLGLEAPVFVYDYPSSQAALAKTSAQNPFFAERFELYINGKELANAFSELIDPKEQRERLIEEQQLRKKLNKPIFAIDEEFLTSLESIQLPSAGIALGVDRLLMVLLEKEKIEEILLFPMTHMLNQMNNGINN